MRFPLFPSPIRVTDSSMERLAEAVGAGRVPG
jgi:hypothetical protein